MTHGRAVALMVLATLLWSIAGVVTRHLDAARSFEVTFWRSRFNALTLLLLLLPLRGTALFRDILAGNRVIWFSGLCWATMYTTFMVALTLTSVANVLVAMSTGPLLTALSARIFLGHRLPLRTWIAIGVAGLGIVLGLAFGGLFAWLNRFVHEPNVAFTVSLLALLKSPAKRVIGFCWPYQAEFDARFAIRRWCDEGAIAALPEVVGKALPLRFRQWWPGAPMTRGVYDIPVPDGTPELQPDVLVVPMNAFDDRGYRLGYGGGYFDRTIAALRPRVVTIGVSHEHCRLPTIYPQPHDIALDFVVTEAGVYAAGSGLPALLDTEIAHAHLQKLAVGWSAPDGNQ